MTALIVLAVIVAVFWLIGCIRLGGKLRFDADGFFIWILAGPMKLQVLPAGPKKPKKEKPEKEEKEKKEKKPKKEKPKKPKPEGQPGTLTRLMSLLPTVLEAVGKLFHKIRIDDLDLKLIWGGSDAASIAIGYGRANAALGLIWPQLENAFIIKKSNIDIDMDYGRTSPGVEILAAFTITVGQIVSLALWYGIKLLIQWIRSGKPAA